MTVDPVAFNIGPLQVRWYGILMAIAVIIGIALARREAVRKGIDPEHIFNMVIIIAPLPGKGHGFIMWHLTGRFTGTIQLRYSKSGTGDWLSLINVANHQASHRSWFNLSNITENMKKWLGIAFPSHSCIMNIYAVIYGFCIASLLFLFLTKQILRDNI